MNNNFGGSLLTSGSPEVYKPRVHANGTLTVEALPDVEEHHVFFTSPDGNKHFLAEHPNGYACAALVDRIIEVWDDKVSDYYIKRYHNAGGYALHQLDFILDCGGSIAPREEVETLITTGKLPHEK